LKQGKKEVSEQFKYAWALVPEARRGLFYATFNQAFAIAAHTAPTRTVFRHGTDKFPVFAPRFQLLSV
jgi:hypothetical protein